MGVLDLEQAELASSANPGSGNRVEVPAPSCQCEVSVFALVNRERRTAQPFTRWRNRSRGAQRRREWTSWRTYHDWSGTAPKGAKGPGSAARFAYLQHRNHETQSRPADL